MQQYIYKEPDYAGGFTYTCIEDNHIVRRDNNWNVLAVKPIDYVEKGLKTKHGIVEGIVNDRVMLKSLSGERYSCDRYLLNCSIIKEKQQETALRKSYVQRFRGGGVLSKSIDFESQHPRDDFGRFTKKDINHSRVIADFEFFKKHCTGKYTTPIGDVEVKQTLFRKMIGAKIGEEAFLKIIKSGKVSWDDIGYNRNYSDKLIKYFKELLTDPDEVLDINQHLGGDYLFVLSKDENTYHAAISKNEIIINYHNFRKKYIQDKEFEVVYRKAGLKKSVKIKYPSFLRNAQRGIFCTGNLAKSETLVKHYFVTDIGEISTMNKGMFNLPNIFRRKSGLTGTAPSQNPEGSASTGVAWNIKGGQKPGHKYIERRPSKTNPDKYIYLYELPNGDRQWRDDAGNEVEETQGETLNDYNVGDFVKVNDDHYMVESASDNYLGLVDNQGRQFHIDKAKMKQIAEYENTLSIGDTYQKENSMFDGMKIVGISDQYLLLRSKDGNSQHLVNRADTVKKTDVANPYEFDEKYREDQKDFAKAGYIQTDINKWEQNIVLGYNTVKHEMGFSRDTGKWYNKYNDKDEYVLQYNGKLYNLRGMHTNGQVIVQDRETGEEYTATKAEIAAGRPMQESTNRVDIGGEQTKFWEGDPNADIFEAINSIKDRNATFEDIAEITGRDIQDVKETVFDLVNTLELDNEGNDWTGSGSISIGKESADRKLARKKPKTEKKGKKNKGIEDVVRPTEPSKEMMESASRREALLQNPDYTSGRTRLESEGFSIAGDDAFMTKKTDVNGSKYVIEKKFNPETNRWEGRVAKGRYKTLKVEGKEYTITDITDAGVEVIDPAPDGTVFGKSYSWEDLERLNGKRIFDPIDSIGLVSAKAPAKIYFADKEEYSEEVTYEIVNSADLIASHNPDGSINPKYTITGAQNRDRSDKRSQSQFTSIATTPIFAKLSDSNDVSGSPIVDQNYNVIAGNGRAIGLELHYGNGGSSYKEELVKNAEKFGFDPKEVSNMDAPILIRRVNVTPERAVDLGNISNRETQESQTATEKARSIARTIKPRTFEKLSELISQDVNDGEMTLSQLIQKRGSDIALFLIREGVIFENEAGNYFNSAKGKVDSDVQREALAKLITQLAIGEASDSFNKISAAAIKGVSAATPLIFSLKGKPGDISNDLSDAVLLARMHLMKSDSDVESGSSRPLKREDTKSFLELQASDMFNPNNPSPRAIAIYESLMKDKQTAITDKILNYGKKLQGDMFEEAKTPEEAFSESFKINYPDGLFPGNTDYKVTHKESEEPGIKIDKAEKKAEQPKTEKQPVPEKPKESEEQPKTDTVEPELKSKEEVSKERRDKIYNHLKSEYEKHGVDLDDSTINEDADYFNDAAAEQGHDDKKLFDEVLANHIKKMKREHPKQAEPEDGGFF